MNDVEHGRSLTCTAAKYSAVKSQVIYKLKHPGDRMIKILAAIPYTRWDYSVVGMMRKQQI